MGEHCCQTLLNIIKIEIRFETCYTQKHTMQCGGDSSGDDWPPNSRLQSSPHLSSLTRKKSKTREDGAARRVHVRATMTMPPHHHQIRVQKTHCKGVKALAIQEAGKKDKILHSRTPPKNGCFTVLLQYTIQWIGTAVSSPKTVACSRRDSLSHSQTVGRVSKGHYLTMRLLPLIAL
jgi:hypothetical protein